MLLREASPSVCLPQMLAVVEAPAVLRPEGCTNFSLVKPPTASFKGALLMKGDSCDLQGRSMRHEAVPHITDFSMSVADRSCLRVPRKPLLSASRLSAGLQDLVRT